MNKKRLLKLADFLETIPRKAFNLNVFREGPRAEENITPQEATKCNTVGCAIGWCPVVFPKLCRPKRNIPWIEIVTDKNNDSWKAAEEIFDLHDTEVSYLFDPASYRKSHRGPKSVATRIKDFVNKNGKISKETKAWNQGYMW